MVVADLTNSKSVEESTMNTLMAVASAGTAAIAMNACGLSPVRFVIPAKLTP